MQPAICVYAASRSGIDPTYFQAAVELGAAIAQNGYALIYGGGNSGLMGETARAVHASGGRVIGVIPAFMRDDGAAYEAADELIVTRDLRERKGIMDVRATAFVGLPGGFGTLEELLEIITLKQLRVHDKPIVLLDVNGFYQPLVSLFDHIIRERFAKLVHQDLYYVAPDVPDAFRYLNADKLRTTSS